MKPIIKIFKNPLELADALAKEFFQVVGKYSQKKLTVALSGGSTPKMFFEQLALITQNKKNFWDNVHFFWGDERCVPPDHGDSNFGMTKKALFDKISIPGQNIHRIVGEENPANEVRRYETEIKKYLPAKENLPCFDWILLGLGTDGHTASIFPKSEVLSVKNKICSGAIHPVSGQKRITVTLPVINQAERVTFLIVGDSKARVVKSILKKEKPEELLPASHVNPQNGILEWYLDEKSAKFIDQY